MIASDTWLTVLRWLAPKLNLFGGEEAGGLEEIRHRRSNFCVAGLEAHAVVVDRGTLCLFVKRLVIVEDNEGPTNGSVVILEQIDNVRFRRKQYVQPFLIGNYDDMQHTLDAILANGIYVHPGNNTKGNRSVPIIIALHVSLQTVTILCPLSSI